MESHEVELKNSILMASGTDLCLPRVSPTFELFELTRAATSSRVYRCFRAQALPLSLDRGNNWHGFAVKLAKENEMHNKHRIRKCTEEDARLLSAIASSTFLETYAGLLPTDEILAHCDVHYSATKFSEALKSSEFSAAVLETQPISTAIGYRVLEQVKVETDAFLIHDFELKKLYVLGRFHGTGLGRALISEAVAEAGKRGARRLVLGVYEKNASAIRFYERIGFRPIGERSVRVGSLNLRDILMARVVR